VLIKYATQEDINYIRQSFTSKQDWTEYLWYMWFEKFDYEQRYWTPIIVAKDWDVVIWFVMLEYDSTKSEALISALYVYSDYRKQWVAKSLYEFCLNDIKEKSFNFVRANVYDNNEPMKKLIAKLWFTQIWYRDYAHKRYWERWKLNFYWKFLD